MKKMKLFLNLLFCVAIAFGLSSCDDDNNDPVELTEQEVFLKEMAQQYLDATVYPTYKHLSDSTAVLYDKLVKLKASAKTSSATQAQIDEVCRIFLNARRNYELSEAFLFGAASDFGIDPHIDTWPLDLDGLKTALKNTTQLNAMDAEDGDVYAGGKLGQDLLGFHGIEYILFRNGASRLASSLNSSDADLDNLSGYYEMIYAVAVAGDLRNKCFQMEVAWNKNADANKIAKVVDDLELPITVTGSDSSYGENFMNAGQAGSSYASWRAIANAILISGCVNISDEVGNTKMGKPFTGEDANYLESPYSYNSLNDFENNIYSIENSYMGGRTELRDETKSLHAYLKKYNSAMDSKVTSAIENAIAKIKACPFPFDKNYTAPEVQTAIDACNTLSAALREASEWISKN